MEIEKLAKRLIQGDEEAFAALVDRFTPLVSTIIYNLANGSLKRSKALTWAAARIGLPNRYTNT